MLIPSVTTVIGPWQDFSRIPPGVLEHASSRGTAVHEVCAVYSRGLFAVVDDEEVRPYFESFCAAMSIGFLWVSVRGTSGT